MKLRGKIAKDGLIFLLSTLQALSKLGSEAAMLLSEQQVRITALTESIDCPHSYLEVVVSMLFTEYRIESQCDNHIALEINLHILSQALTSGKSSSHVVLKLTKKTDKPCLSISLEGQDSLYSMDVCHDVPVKLIKVTEQLHFIQPPQISPPTVGLILPKSKTFKTIVERLGKFSRFLSIHAFQTGRMELKIESAAVDIHTLVHGLKPYNSEAERFNVCSTNDVVACIQIKRLSAILDYQQIAHNDAIIFFTRNEAIVLYLELMSQMGSLTFYLPVLVIDDLDQIPP